MSDARRIVLLALPLVAGAVMFAVFLAVVFDRAEASGSIDGLESILRAACEITVIVARSGILGSTCAENETALRDFDRVTTT